MALAALESFISNPEASDTIGDFNDKIDTAKTRAIDIARLAANKNAGNITEKFILPGDTDNKLEISFGQWRFDPPPNGCDGEIEGIPNANNPAFCCIGTVFTPCFFDLIGETDPEERFRLTNALRIDFTSRTDADGGFLSLFSDILRPNSLEFQLTATAAMVPRNGVFLVDLSRSTQFETHIPAERLPSTQLQNASEFAYRLGGDLTCANVPVAFGGTLNMNNANCGDLSEQRDACDNLFTSGTAQHDACLSPSITLCTDQIAACDVSFTPGTPDHDNCLISDCPACLSSQCPALSDLQYHVIFHSYTYPDRSIPATEPPGASGVGVADTGSPTRHFKNDYDCVAISPPDGATEYYLIDAVTNPEPLSTILGGINSTLEEIEERGVSGDQVSFIGFDDSVFTASAPLAGLRHFGPITPNTDAYENLKQIMTVPSSAGKWSTVPYYISSFLFPGTTGATAAGPNPTRGGTDLPLALTTAQGVLQSTDNFSAAFNFVSLFSDGMVNCYHGVDAGGTNRCLFTSSSLGTQVCMSASPYNVSLVGTAGTAVPALLPENNSYYAHLWGLKESTEIISRNGGDAGIGNFDNDGRHELTPSDQGSCTGEDTVPSFVDLGITFNYFPIGQNVAPFNYIIRNGDEDECQSDDDLLNNIPDNSPLGGDDQLFGLLAGAIDSLLHDPHDAYLTKHCDETLSAGLQQICEDWLDYDGTTVTVDPPQSYTLAHHYLYTFGVHPTGGVYAPIRPSCSDVGFSCGGPGGTIILDNLEDACTLASSGSSPTASAPTEGTPGGNMTILTCNPECRTKSQQVKDGIQKIYDENTFQIVE